jgi:hypothetical protein
MKQLIFMLLFLPLNLWCQEYRKCPNFNSEEKWEDQNAFVENQKDVLNLLEWLTSTPPAEQLVQRSAASIFVMEWMTKHPNFKVNVEVGAYAEYLISEDLTLAYLFGNILYVLKHESKVKPDAQRIAGLKSLLFVIEHSELYSKNRIFKSLLRANRKGELIEFDKEVWLNHKAHAVLSLEKKIE